MVAIREVILHVGSVLVFTFVNLGERGRGVEGLAPISMLGESDTTAVTVGG